MHRTFREELTPILLKLFQKIVDDGRFPSSFNDATITVIPKLDKAITKKENYRQISMMNIDTKVLNKILANSTQRGSHTMIKWGLSGMQKFFNTCKSINVIHHINKLKEKTILFSQ